MKLFKQLKAMKEVFKAAKNVNMGIVKSELKTKGSLEYYHSNDQVVATGAVIAATGTNILGQEIIIVDDRFERADEDQQNFILQHEIGHQVLGHVKEIANNPQLAKQEMKNRNKKGYVSERELAADKYAYEKVGLEATLKAFDFMEETLDDIGINTREVKARREAIIKLAKGVY